MNIEPQPLTAEAIAPFGTLLEAQQDGFQSLVTIDEAVGWQLALNKVVDKQATSIHRHFNTRECFAPLRGNAVVLLAPPEDRTQIVAFYLTAPVCIFANVWHTTFSPSGDALVMICENAEVEGELVDLPSPIRA